MLTEFSSSYSHVFAVVRDPSSDKSKAIAAQGAELRKVDEDSYGPSLEKAFEGADVVVNALGNAPVDKRDAVFDAALKQGVKVYFTSDYGR